MDLANLKPSELDVEINHPATGAPLGIRVTLMSLDDERMKRIRRQITDETLKLNAKGKSLKADELERNTNMLLFNATTNWHWYNPTGAEGDPGFDASAMPTLDGETPEYNQKNFVAMVSRFSWFAEQIREPLEDTKAFFANSKST